MSYCQSQFEPISGPNASAAYYRLRRQRQEWDWSGVDLMDPATLEQIVDVDHLAAVYDRMRREAGRSPGPDGVRYGDLGRGELFDVLRGLKTSILSGTYRPGRGRQVRIPKASGGYRVLTLTDIADRIVARALTDATTPYFERVFLNRSHGFRPGRSTWTLLAELERVVTAEGRWVLAVDDVRAAFDMVRLADAIDDFRPVVSYVLLGNLVIPVLTGGHRNKQVGIAQGCPFSPLALNARLHAVHDSVMNQVVTHASGVIPGTKTFWFRYADNVVYACQDAAEGMQVLRKANQALTAAGFALKRENGGQPVDLRVHGSNAQVLGFAVFKGKGRLRVIPGDGAWDNLRSNLLQAHSAEDPTQAAFLAVKGWIEAYGPAFGNRTDRTVGRILDVAAHYGFREMYSREGLAGLCRSSFGRRAHKAHYGRDDDQNV